MNRGIMMKAIREIWPTTLLLGVAILVVEGVLAYVLPTFSQMFSEKMMQLKFFENMIKAMLGTEMSGSIGPEIFSSIPWVHPVVLALTWAHAIVVCTRVPAGEIDRGTVDVLLGLPISRWELFLSENVVWICSALVMMTLGVIGNTIGNLNAPPDARLSFARVVIVLVNLLCLYVAVGGAAWLASALSDRRGRAITVLFALVLASFLLNYLAQFWEPADRVVFLSILRYYRPLFILRDGAWPLHDMLVLLGIAGVLWTAAGIVFARRDLCTV